MWPRCATLHAAILTEPDGIYYAMLYANLCNNNSDSRIIIGPVLQIQRQIQCISSGWYDLLLLLYLCSSPWIPGHLLDVLCYSGPGVGWFSVTWLALNFHPTNQQLVSGSGTRRKCVTVVVGWRVGKGTCFKTSRPSILTVFQSGLRGPSTEPGRSGLEMVKRGDVDPAIGTHWVHRQTDRW